MKYGVIILNLNMVKYLKERLELQYEDLIVLYIDAPQTSVSETDLEQRYSNIYQTVQVIANKLVDSNIYLEQLKDTNIDGFELHILDNTRKRRDFYSRKIDEMMNIVKNMKGDLENMEADYTINEIEKIDTNSKNVFIVHGHDYNMRTRVENTLRKLGLNPIILGDQVNRGRTIIEKFEEESEKSSFVVVLLSEDDATGDEEIKRARQNVIFELGYFVGKIGRGNVLMLRNGNPEIPSDLFGVLYEEYNPDTKDWEHKLVKEMNATKQFELDSNKL